LIFFCHFTRIFFIRLFYKIIISNPRFPFNRNLILRRARVVSLHPLGLFF